MSFVEAFYSFNLDITNADSGVSASLRLKTARHPYESLQFLYARLLAFCHAYEPELRFSQGLFSPDEPTIWKRDVIGEISTWVEIGALDPKKLKSALRASERSNLNTRFRCYFFEDEHVSHFCNELRGSKSNWIEPVSFFRLAPDALARLCETETSSARWTVTIVDSAIYLNCDGAEIETEVTAIDIWHEFQHSIGNLPPAA